MSRFLRFAVFFIAFAAILASSHYYVAKRLVIDPGVDGPLRGAALAAIAVLGALLLLHPASVRLFGRRYPKGLALVTASWLGLWWILVVVLALTDGAAAVLASVSPLAFPPGASAGAKALVSLAFVAVAAGSGARSALREPGVRSVEIRLRRWPAALDGYRVVQLSDVHVGRVIRRRFVADMVRRVNALSPDLVAITGDLVDGSVAELGSEVEPLAELVARDGAYFVTGNHEYFSGADAWVARLRALGIRVLRNERVRIGTGGAGFELAGVDDPHGALVGGGGEDLARALGGRDPRSALVLLAHQPRTFHRAAGFGIDLQLSGHTHGGQIWPFGAVVRMTTPYVRGHHREGEAQLYVSRGTGFWGPPLRLFAPAEITEIVVRAAADRERYRAP